MKKQLLLCWALAGCLLSCTTTDTAPSNQEIALVNQLGGRWRWRNMVVDDLGAGELCYQPQQIKDIDLTIEGNTLSLQSAVNQFRGNATFRPDGTVSVANLVAQTSLTGAAAATTCEQTVIELLRTAKVFRIESGDRFPATKESIDLLVIGPQFLANPQDGKARYVVFERLK